MANNKLSIDTYLEEGCSKVPPKYWLRVCGGQEAAMAFVTADPGDPLYHTLFAHPILWVPGFPKAMKIFGESYNDANLTKFITGRAELLAQAVRSTIMDNLDIYVAMVGQASTQLAQEMNFDRRIHLNLAIDIMRQMRLYLSGEMSLPVEEGIKEIEAYAHFQLAQIGEDVRANLEIAIYLYEQALAALGETEETAMLLHNLGAAHMLLTIHNIEKKVEIEPLTNCDLNWDAELAHLAAALSAYTRSRKLQADTKLKVITLADEIVSHNIRVKIVPDSLEDDEAILVLSGQFRELVAEATPAYRIKVLTNEAKARLRLAKGAVAETTNLLAAVESLAEARDLIDSNDPNWADTLRDESECRLRLAERMIDPKANLATARILIDQVLSKQPNPDKLATFLSMAGNIRFLQGALCDLDPIINYRDAITLQVQARFLFPANSKELAFCIINEVNARLNLVELEIDSLADLDATTNLLAHAKDWLTEPAELGVCFNTLAQVRIKLAELGVDTHNNLVQSLDLIQQAREQIQENTSDHYNLCLNEAETRLRLASNIDINPKPHLEAAVKLLEDVLEIPKHPSKKSSVLLNLGISYMLLGQNGIDIEDNFLKAKNLFKQARAVLPADHPAIPKCLYNEAAVRRGIAELGIDPKANIQKGLELLDRAYKLFTGKPAEAARSLSLSGSLRVSLAAQGIDPPGQLQKAIEEQARARALISDISDLEKSDVAISLMHEAIARLDLSRFGIDSLVNLETALDCFAQARQLLPPDSIKLGWCMGNEGNVHSMLAVLGVNPVEHTLAAVNLYHKAKGLLPKGCLDHSRCTASEGIAHMRLAELGEEPIKNLKTAVTLFEQARTSVMSEGTIDYARSLLVEARVLKELANHEFDREDNLKTALTLCSQAREIFPKGTIDFGLTLINEADILKDQLYGEIVEAQFDSPEVIFSSLIMSKALWVQEMYESAGELFERCSLFSEAMKAYHLLGDLLVKLGRSDDALVSFSRAIRNLDQIRSRTSLIRDRGHWAEKSLRLFNTTIEVALHLGHVNEATEWVERSRSWVLADLLTREEQRLPHTDPATAAEYSKLLRDLAELESAMILRDNSVIGLGRLDAPRINFERFSILTEQLRKLEVHIRRDDPDFLATAEPLNAESLQRLADRLDRPLLILWSGKQYGAAFLVRAHNSCIEHIPLPDLRDDIVQGWVFGSEKKEYSGWLGALRQFQAGMTTKEEWISKMDLVLKQVYEAVMGPVRERLLPSERALACIVAGPLGLIPLHAASWSEGGKLRYVLEELELMYAPSAWVLDRCFSQSAPHAGHLLGVANPDGTLQLGSWELETIASRLVGSNLGPLTSIIGDAATASAVESALRTHALAYLSCHGEYNEQEPLHSTLWFAQKTKLRLVDLLRHRQETLRFAVLSACESAIGSSNNARNEEYLGLPAGFIVAGAKTVIGTLAAVPEESTALLMVKLFEELAREGNTIGLGEALRRAQTWLKGLSRAEAVCLAENSGFSATLSAAGFQGLEKYNDPPFSSPIYWASFVAYGSPQPVVPEGTFGNGNTLL
ncbi:CHAT domain-containing protein [Methylobacter marinus]|uniref:CHAT domain-containing protein n=1 Tax=Methylobacter marinus TaxID=34058 RepID=UPI000382469B|nr:CHAT domain-containing protein [Methylobacter marinus]